MEATQPIIDFQRVYTGDAFVPNAEQLHLWVSQALPKDKQDSEITIRIVEQEESQALNSAYRQKDKPTNVLSFPSDLPDFIEEPYLGDLVVCADVVAREACEQQKENEAHWAHMIIHGTLHLLGYDHINDSDAEIMESHEKTLLNALGYKDPYTEQAL